jgi:hypothetical protein
MTTRTPWLAALAALCIVAPVQAQPVEVAPLPAPDLFTAAARETGLHDDLWRGASAATFQTTAAALADRPLSPAARALGVRLLATGAPAPSGGDEAALAALRLRALVAMGDIVGARSILSRTPNPERAAPLAQAAAEVALLSGEEDHACQIAEALPGGRGELYWLRLRAFCLHKAGQGGAAQLTFDLAQGQARDPVFGRLMGARLAGAGDPGPASLRNGLDLALSRALGLDLKAAKPAPTVVAALSGGPPPAPAWPFTPADTPVARALAAVAVGDFVGAEQIRGGLIHDPIPGATPDDLALFDAALATGRGRVDAATLDRLVERGGQADPKARGKLQAAAVILAALGWPLDTEARGDLARFAVLETKAPPARLLALDLAADARLLGETGLLAAGLAADAGPAGPAAADRARIVRALKVVGLEEDARAFALEGLIGLR